MLKCKGWPDDGEKIGEDDKGMEEEQKWLRRMIIGL